MCLSIELLVIYSKWLSVNSRAWNLLQQFPLHLCIQYCSHLPPCTISLVSGSTATKHQHHGVGMWLMTSQELVSVFSTWHNNSECSLGWHGAGSSPPSYFPHLPQWGWGVCWCNYQSVLPPQQSPGHWQLLEWNGFEDTQGEWTTHLCFWVVWMTCLLNSLSSWHSNSECPFEAEECVSAPGHWQLLATSSKFAAQNPDL